VTVKAVDAYGNRLSTGTNIYTGTIKFTDWTYDNGDTISKTRFGDSILPTYYTFTTGPGEDNGYHVFNATASFRRKTTNGWIKARDDTAAKEGTKSGIVVNAGDLDHYNVSMATSCTAGIWYDVTITAQDQFNNLKEQGANITFECSLVAGEWENKGVYTLPSGGQGTASEWVRFKKTGTGIWVKGKDAANNYGTQTGIEVVAGPAHHLKAYGYPSPVTAGVSGNYVYVKAEDEFNNQYYHYTGTVTFNSDCPNVTLPSDWQFSDPNPEGGQPFQVIFKSAGTWDIYVADANNFSIINGTQTNIVVNPSSLDHFEVTTSTNQTIDVRYSVTVEALDSYDNRVSVYVGTITFSSDASEVSFLPSTYKFTTGPSGDNGIHTFSAPTYGVKFSTSGTYYVRVTDDDTGKTGQQSGIYVTTRPDSLTTFPSNNDYINALTPPAIVGTLYDDESVTEIKVKIIRVSNNYQWDEDVTDWVDPGVSGEQWNNCNVYTSSWSYNATSPVWISGNSYEIISRAKDNKGNYEIDITTITFLFDNSDPSTVFTAPVQDGHRNSPFKVEGTAVDEPVGFDSGLFQLKLRITQIATDGTTYYWDIPTWGATPNWLSPSAGTSWIYTTIPTWTNGLLHKIYAYHIDYAGNIESTKTVSFVYDTEAPDSYLGKPDSSFESDVSLSKIWGTSVDHPDSPYWNAGVGGVQVRISSGTGTNIFWNGSSWQSISPDSAWQDADLWASSWTYTSGIPACFSEGVTYVINSRAYDNTTSDGTSNPNMEVSITTQTFVYDTTEPVSEMTVPAEATSYETMNNIYGTCSDASPGEVDYVQIRIKQVSGGSLSNYYWDWQNNNWSLSPAQEWSDPIYPAGQNWNIDTSGINWEADADGVDYRTWYRAVDKAGNTETESYHEWTFTSPLPDTVVTEPTGTDLNPNYYRLPTQIKGTADQYTSADKVWVILSSGPTYSTYWNNDTESWVSSQYENLVDTPTGTFPDNNPWIFTISTNAWTDGVKYLIKSKGEGPAGEETDLTDRYFVIDQTPPDSEMQNPSDGDHRQTISTIAGTSWDYDLGKIGGVEIRIQNATLGYYQEGAWGGSAYWITCLPSDGTFDSINEGWQWDVDYETECWKQDGTYTIEVRAKDQVTPSANVEASPYDSVSIVIDNSPPSSWMIAPTTYTYYYNSLATIWGTGADDSPGKWNNIKLEILNRDTTRFWDGDSWLFGPSEYWLTNTDPDMSIYSSSWTYVGVSWLSGYEYRITEWGIDKAGNVEASSHTAIILFDDKAPLSGGTQPSPDGHYNALDEIRGTAADYTVGQQRVSDVAGVKIAYKGLGPTNTNYWNQTDWTGTSPKWFDAAYAVSGDY